MSTIGFIPANWPVPGNVFAGTTTKPYNLAVNSAKIITARERLKRTLELSSEPVWLNQKHTNNVIKITADFFYDNTPADGAFSTQAGTVCAVLTADCLPVLLCNRQGTEVAALHGGWRGLLNNIIQRGVANFTVPSTEIIAWLGPAISAKLYEVGPEVRELFLQNCAALEFAFKSSPNENHWLLDLCGIAKFQLQTLGVKEIYGGDFCTYSDSQNFHSYRRDGDSAGRMATLISC